METEAGQERRDEEGKWRGREDGRDRIVRWDGPSGPSVSAVDARWASSFTGPIGLLSLLSDASLLVGLAGLLRVRGVTCLASLRPGHVATVEAGWTAGWISGVRIRGPREGVDLGTGHGFSGRARTRSVRYGESMARHSMVTVGAVPARYEG